MAEDSLVEEEPKYIAYPRRGYGSRYGTLARLEALGLFCKSMNEALIATMVMTVVFEVSLASFGHSQELLTVALLLLTGAGTFSLVSKRTSLLASGMGWHRTVGHGMGALAILLVFAVFEAMRTDLGWLWVIPPLAIFFVGGIGVYIANTEMSRYGIPISPFTSRAPKEVFEHAVRVRRAIDQNPADLASTDMFSGEPPGVG